MRRFVGLLVLFSGVAIARADDYVTYVSLAGDDKIAAFRFDADHGTLTHAHDTETAGGPGSLVIGPNRKFLYAAIRSTGRLSSFRVSPQSGLLAPISTIEADADPAFVGLDQSGRFLLSAYYLAGKVAIHPIDSNGQIDAATAHWYDTAEKAHAIVADRSNRFLFVPHTGPNAIYQFTLVAGRGTLRPNRPAKLTRPTNTGPRHLVFHPSLDIAYCVNEQGGSVTSYRFDARQGTLSPLETASTLPEGFSGDNACADIELTPSGRFLYASNRGHDSIAGFAVNPKTGTLTPIGRFPTEKTPRQFNIDPTGRFLIAAGQSTGRLAVFSIDPKAGHLRRTQTYTTGRQPWWVMTIKLPG